MKKPFSVDSILLLAGISLATTYVTTSIVFATLNVRAKEIAEVALQEEAFRKQEILVKEKRDKREKLRYNRFHVQFFKPIKACDLEAELKESFPAEYIRVDALFPTDLRRIQEVVIGSNMSIEQVRQALLNWKKVVKVLTYPEVWDAAFPEVEGLE